MVQQTENKVPSDSDKLATDKTVRVADLGGTYSGPLGQLFVVQLPGGTIGSTFFRRVVGNRILREMGV